MATRTTTGRRAVLRLPAAVAVASLGRPAGRGGADAGTASSVGPDQPLGIGPETWPYPHPVSFLPVTMSSQTLRMAFMDVPPGKNFDGSVPRCARGDAASPVGPWALRRAQPADPVAVAGRRC